MVSARRVHVFAIALMAPALLLAGCSEQTPDPDPVDDSNPTASDAPMTIDRDEFEAFLRMSLRQVDDAKLDCIVGELDQTLSDERATEFVDTLSAGAQPPRETLVIVSAAAKACRAGSVV